MKLHRLMFLAVQLIVLSAAVAAPPADDPLRRPALPSPRSASVMTTAVTRAGDRLVAVGDRGVILLSDDSGNHWRQATVPVSVLLTGVRFATPQIGWAVGHSGVVLKTLDAGQTWALQLDGERAAELVREAAASAELDPARATRLAAEAQRLVREGADKPWLDVAVSDAQHVTVVGAFGLALGSEDGGAHWRSRGHELPNPQGAHLYGMAQSGATVVIAGEQGLLLRSADKGRTFVDAGTGSKASNFGLLLLSERQWLVYGLHGTAFVCDADAACTPSRIAETGALTAGLRCRDGRIVVASQSGMLHVSTDGGRSFTSRAVPHRAPVIGLAEAPDGSLSIASARGMLRLERASLESQS